MKQHLSYKIFVLWLQDSDFDIYTSELQTKDHIIHPFTK